MLNSDNLSTWCEESTHWKRPWTLGKIAGKRRRRWQRMRWLYSISYSMDMNLSKLWEIVEDRGAWCATVKGVTKSQTRLSDWTTTTKKSVFVWGMWFSISQRGSFLSSPIGILNQSMLTMSCRAGRWKETSRIGHLRDTDNTKCVMDSTRSPPMSHWE